MKLSNKQTLWILMMGLTFTLLLPINTYAQDKIGHVIFTTGELTASKNGKTRLLKRGSSIQAGDVVKSSSDTISQIRMQDNALIALKPDTEFGFDQYRFSDKPENNSSFFSLIKGGFRTITGLIGKQNKKNYKIKTPVATIGIRGTHYGLTLCQQGDCSDETGDVTDGLYGSVIDGEIVTENEAGAFTFSNDEYFLITGAGNKPENLLKPPGVVFNPDKIRKRQKQKEMARPHLKRELQLNAMMMANHDKRPPMPPIFRPDFVAAGCATCGTTSFLLPAKIGDAFAFSFFDATGGVPLPVFDKIIVDGTGQNNFALNATAAQNGLFIPVSAIQQAIGAPKRTLFKADAIVQDVGSFTVPVAGTTGISVGWGRWAGNFIAAENDVARKTPGNLHYVVANNIFDPANIGTLSAIGTATYSVVGSTRPTDRNGIPALNPATIAMTMNFANSQINLDIDTTVAGNIYSASSGFVTYTGNLGLTGTAACTTCSGQATVALIGPQAQAAAALYTIRNTAAINTVTGTTGNAINGAAVLKR